MKDIELCKKEFNLTADIKKYLLLKLINEI